MTLGSLLAASVALATTYVRVEKDGTKTYSDRPLPGGHPVEIQPAQTYPAQPVAPTGSSSLPAEQRDLIAAANFKYQCALNPPNEETFQNPESVSVSVALSPALRAGDEIRFALDGIQVPLELGSTGTTISNPDRGSHTLTVRVTDASGKSLCDASSIFHVQRTNLNSPTRRPTPTPRR